MKRLSYLFIVLAIILSDIMCAVVSYNYCDLLWGAEYAGYSAPASTAFLYAVPFVVVIVICIIAAWILHKKAL